MAYTPIQAYRKTNMPVLPGGERDYLERELKKLEEIIRGLITAIEELRAKVP